jgi:hypothetical protein
MREIKRIGAYTKKIKIVQQVIVIQLMKRPNRTDLSIDLLRSGRDYLERRLREKFTTLF